MTNKHKERTILNFKKAHSLVGKLIKMIDEGEDSVNTMHQIMASIGLLRVAHHLVMEDIVNNCFKKALETENQEEKEELTEEILRAARLFNKINSQ